MDRELLYVFGTGNAAVTNLYNTCFALRDSDEYFMVDAGGGNGILKILDNMQVPVHRIHHIFVTHEHTDHILGIVWMIRMIATGMLKDQYQGDAWIYCHEDLAETIRTLCRLTIQEKHFRFLDSRIHLDPLKDGDHRQILSYAKNMYGTATGCSMRPSAFMWSGICGSPTKNTTAPLRTPANWPRPCRSPIWCCGIRKTATSPDANGCIRAKGRNITAATSLCRTTKA